jgi:hypothetical protein
MSEEPSLPELPPDADPTALLAFMQRLMTTLQQGGDVEALMAEAPPGFDALFMEAQRRMASGELAGLDPFMGGFGGFDEDADDESAAEEGEAEEGGEATR